MNTRKKEEILKEMRADGYIAELDEKGEIKVISEPSHIEIPKSEMLCKLKKLLKEYQSAGWIGKVLISKDLEEISDEEFNYNDHYEIIIYPSSNPKPKNNFMKRTYKKSYSDSEHLLIMSLAEINIKMDYIVWCLNDTILVFSIYFYEEKIIEKDWIIL